MGIFEKSIPRYVYNPVQRQPEVVQDYYVDDIFDPLFNKSVKEALTQKYGNPYLGTVMGYYEGIENALVGQKDKWGILGPGMGILSGFGRSMDKAGDVILGGLTEAVKGVTGQGFENPFQNIFVEDEDYTGRRALAAIANSMSRFAGGTTLTEEDFGPEYGLTSLGIELMTDPSILGGGLSKVAKSPTLLKQLGNAKNGMGKVGKFLQDYDDIMAKASIDLTAPGLRPGIKKLMATFDKYVPKNYALKFTDDTREYTPSVMEDVATIEKMDPEVPETVSAAADAQSRLRTSEELASIVPAADSLKTLENTALLAEPDEVSHHLTNEFEPMSNIERVLKAVLTDVNSQAMFAKQSKAKSVELLDAMEKLIESQETRMGDAYSKVVDVATSHGAKINPRIQSVDELDEIYAELTSTFDTLRKADPTLTWEDFMETGVFKGMPELHPEYADTFDMSPEAWELGAFSEREEDNVRIIKHILDQYRTYTGRELLPYSISSSEIGFTRPMLGVGNAYARNLLEFVFGTAIGNKEIPKFTNSKELQKVFRKGDFGEWFERAIPDVKRRNEAIKIIDDLLFPSEFNRKALDAWDAAYRAGKFGTTGISESAAKNREYHWYKQLERLSEIFRKDVSTWLTADENSKTATVLKQMAIEDPEGFASIPDRLDVIASPQRIFAQRDPAYLNTQHVAKALLDQDIDYYEYLQSLSRTGNVPNELHGRVTVPTYRANGDVIYRKVNLKTQIRKDLKALEDARNRVLKSVYEYKNPTGYNFLKNLQLTLDEIRQKYIQRMRGQFSHSDQVDVGFSINAPVKNSKDLGLDKGTTYADIIADVGYGEDYALRKSATDAIDVTPVRSKDPATHLKSDSAIYTPNLRMLQQIVRENPEIYGPTNPNWVRNLGELYAPVKEFAQIKMRDGSELHSFNILTDDLQVFKNKVLPAVKQRLAQGKFPFMAKAQRYQDPELYDLLYSYNSPHRKALEQVLYKKDGKYYIDEFAPISHIYHTDNLKQPFLGTAEVKYRMDISKLQSEVNSNRAAFAKQYKVPTEQAYATAPIVQSETIAKATPSEAAKLIENPPTVADAIVFEAAAPAAEALEMSSKGISDDVVEATVPKKIWHWFQKISDAIAVRTKSMGLLKDEKTGEYFGRATLRTSKNEALITEGRRLIYEDGVQQSTVRDVMKLLTERDGDVLTGVEFFDEIRRSQIIQASFSDAASAGAAATTLQHNVDVFNAAVGGDALKLLKRKMSNGNYEIKVLFNTKNTKVVDQIRKHLKELGKANFVDTTFLKARPLTTDELKFLSSKESQQVLAYLESVNAAARDQAKMLGFNFNETAVHNKHVRNVNAETANYVANDIYNGIALDDLDEIGTVMSNLDEFRKFDKGVFGTQLQGRRFRGAYWNYNTSRAELFTNNLEHIAKGSLGDGMFANSNYQSFVDLFVNDNFKINDVFEDVEDFKKFMYAGGSEGMYSGNFKNIDLCAAKFDENGQIVGIHKYNVNSDADLERALKNPDTILVPANTVDTLDKILRKEVRLSNKAYAFINKHFTIPFKFGVLTNPGFLIGNISDAYTKQAISMYRKYGTSVNEELAKVGEASAMYLNLGNSFNAAVEKWWKLMSDEGVSLSAAERVPEVLAGHAPSRKRLMEYVQGTLTVPGSKEPLQCMLSDEERGTILLWTRLQQLQHTSNSLREFDELDDAIGKSKYDVSRNIIDRITQGSGKYSGRKLSTWGLFINNPIANNAMKASELIENTMRGTAILNDLMHEGYSKQDIFKLLLDPAHNEEMYAAKLSFDVDFADAVNAMYESNFNYERMSDFMEGVGKAMPFPTFFLKNFSYWMSLFAEDPQLFDHAITVHESMWATRDTSEAQIEAEAKGRGAIPLAVPEGLDNASGQKLSKLFKGIYKPTPLQSMFGAFSLLNSPVENLSYRLHPAISGSAQAVNQAIPSHPLTTFLGEAKYRPYSTDIYERNVTQDDENFNVLAYTAHRANPFERAISTGLRTPNKMLEGQAQLSDFLPSVFQPDFGKK